MKYSSKLDILRSICITNILNCIIMLGINAPKVLAKGKYAQAVRKAALASIGTKAKKDDASKTSKHLNPFLLKEIEKDGIEVIANRNER